MSIEFETDDVILRPLPVLTMGAETSYLVAPSGKKEDALLVAAMDEFQNAVISANRGLNETYALVQRGSQALVMRQNTDYKGDKTTSYLTTKDFYTILANRRLWHPGDEKWIPIAAAWLTWSKRREYDSVYFLPLRHGEESKIGERHFNLWRGLKCNPIENNGKFEILLDHIQNNICQGDDHTFKWVMAWLADIFQRPARKPGTSLVLRGEMGIGKGAFANHIGYLLATHYFTITNSSQIVGKFNSHLSERVLVFIDESAWSDDKIGEGTLRSLVTEPQIACEAKGKDVIMVDSFLRLVIAANKQWVVPVGMSDERRFTVLDVGEAVQRDFGYFAAMEAELLNGGYEAFLWYLLNYEYPSNLPRDILHTEALLQQKLHSMPNEAKWWYSCLVSEQIEDSNTKWPEFIECGNFYQSYIKWCDVMKINHRLAANSLPRSLYKFANMERKRISGGGWKYIIDPLGKAKDKFATRLGHVLKWDEELPDNNQMEF